MQPCPHTRVALLEAAQGKPHAVLPGQVAVPRHGGPIQRLGGRLRLPGPRAHEGEILGKGDELATGGRCFPDQARALIEVDILAMLKGKTTLRSWGQRRKDSVMTTMGQGMINAHPRGTARAPNTVSSAKRMCLCIQRACKTSERHVGKSLGSASVVGPSGGDAIVLTAAQSSDSALAGALTPTGGPGLAAIYDRSIYGGSARARPRTSCKSHLNL